MHTRVPGFRPSPRALSAQVPSPRTSPLSQLGNFPGAQLVTSARPALRLSVLSQAALLSCLRRPSPAQVGSASPGRAHGAQRGPRAAGATARAACEPETRRARCGQELRRRRCGHLTPPPGPVPEEARREGGGGREGQRRDRGGRGSAGLWRGRAESQLP